MAGTTGLSSTHSTAYQEAVDRGWEQIPIGVRRLLTGDEVLSSRVREAVVHRYLKSAGCSCEDVLADYRQRKVDAFRQAALEVKETGDSRQSVKRMNRDVGGQPDWHKVTTAVSGQGMQQFISQVADVRDRIIGCLRDRRALPGDHRGRLVAAAQLVEAEATSDDDVRVKVALRWPGSDRPEDPAAVREPPATHDRWKRVPDDHDLMADLSGRLSTAWADRPHPVNTPVRTDVVDELSRSLLDVEDRPETVAIWEPIWDRYVSTQPWAIHESSLDLCGLSRHRSAARPPIHPAIPGASPLDQSVLQRLDHPLRQPRELTQVFARTSIVELIDDGIDRSPAPLGLQLRQARAALTLGLKIAALVADNDPRARMNATANAPARFRPIVRVARLARRYHGRHVAHYSSESLQMKVEELAAGGWIAAPKLPALRGAAQDYLNARNEPMKSAGPVIHRRMHRADILHAQANVLPDADYWWDQIDSALNTWIKNIYQNVKTVLEADGRRPLNTPAAATLSPELILELLTRVLDDSEDPLAYLDVTNARYLDLMGAYLSDQYRITPEQARTKLPPWALVSAAISPDVVPEASAVYHRSRMLCRQLNSIDDLKKALPEVAKRLYEKTISEHVAQARAEGALVEIRHYTSSEAFMARLRREEPRGTGQVAGVKRKEES